MSTLNVNTVRDSGGAGTSDTQALGQGQTWQNVAAQRVIGTTYTSTTGRPIQLMFVGGSNATYVLTIGGVTVASWTQSNSQASISAVIPTGATYSIANGSIGTWTELRT